jgi:hypothetical protein
VVVVDKNSGAKDDDFWHNNKEVKCGDHDMAWIKFQLIKMGEVSLV